MNTIQWLTIEAEQMDVAQELIVGAKLEPSEANNLVERAKVGADRANFSEERSDLLRLGLHFWLKVKLDENNF